MPKKNSSKPATRLNAKSEKIVPQQPVRERFPFKLEIPGVPWLTPYIPGILLLLAALVLGLFVYPDYGISWDEPIQRTTGLRSYNYIFYGNQELFTTPTDNHGAGFELLLIILEKWLNLDDLKDIYLMRHLVTHLLFLAGIFSAYILLIRLFKNKFIASLGFVMLLMAPRLYAHSFFNSKDIPFMAILIITVTCCQVAFGKNKPVLFFILGLLCGYATSIRIMGVMLFVFILIFLLIDMAAGFKNKKNGVKPLLNILLFSVGFCFLLYISWPFLWKDPIHKFMESFKKLSDFDVYNGYNLLNGKFVPATKQTWTYFPTWFLITNPELWLIAGFGGIIWITIGFFKKPFHYFTNTPERNFLFYLMCFFTPLLAVFVLHSVIYDDWRHLYFIYPFFVFMALYFINKMLQAKYRRMVQGACALQLILLGYFMVKAHPFQQVYFNNLVSHGNEYLHKNYEMDYWGTSFKQGLEHLLDEDRSAAININANYKVLVENNIIMLPENDRKRIKFADYRNADYLITNFRDHPYDYPSYETAYSIKVLNSTILNVFKVDKDTAKQRKYANEEIANLKRSLPIFPKDGYAETMLGDDYLFSSQYDSAEVYYKHALQFNGKATKVMFVLARIYFMDKRYPESIAINERAISAGATYANTFANIGLAYLYCDKYDSAIYYSHKAISLDPGFNGPYETLSSAYKKTGNLDSAGKYESIARLNDPNFVP